MNFKDILRFASLFQALLFKLVGKSQGLNPNSKFKTHRSSRPLRFDVLPSTTQVPLRVVFRPQRPWAGIFRSPCRSEDRRPKRPRSEDLGQPSSMAQGFTEFIIIKLISPKCATHTAHNTPDYTSPTPRTSPYSPQSPAT